MKLWHWLMLVLAALVGCGDGGQTGDSGVDPAGAEQLCELRGRPIVTVEEAEALGFNVKERLMQAFGNESSVTQELVLVGPPSLWLERGAVPPADRSIPAVITARATGDIEIVDVEPIWPQFADSCLDQALPRIDVEVSVPDLGAMLAGGGTLHAVYTTPLLGHPETFTESLLDLPELGTCRLLLGQIDLGNTGGDPIRQLQCGAVYASSDCLDRSKYSRVPVDERSGLDAREFLARASSVFPFELACEGQRKRETVDFSVSFPDTYCGSKSSVPVIAELDFSLFGWASAPLAASSGFSEDAACLPREPTRCAGKVGNAFLQCMESFPSGEPRDLARQQPCSEVRLTISQGGLELQVQFEEDADGSQIVAVRAWRFRDPAQSRDSNINCYAQQELRRP